MKKQSEQEVLYKKTYNHFRKRLFERYGITVNFKEYINLHNYKLSKSIEQPEKRSILGILIINEMAVKIVKSKYGKGKPLITVLNLNHKDLK